MLEPMLPPVDTLGPSNPTEPPKPTVRALVTMLDQVLLRLTLPLFFEMAYRMPGMPWPTSYFSMYLQNKMVSRIPMAGQTK